MTFVEAPTSAEELAQIDALVMVLLGGVETVSGAVVGAIVFKALSIWLVSQTEWSKLVLGAFVVLIVVMFPKGIVGTFEILVARWRKSPAQEPSTLTSRIGAAE